ncbi:MAG: wax ester/triacylglycerol synthase family O-acyltransferase [Candidatus Dormibacter sp.]
MAVKPFFEPLSARDAWFLYAERPETPLDIGTVYVFEGESRLPGRRGALGVEETVRERIHLVPRYRQRVLRAPWNIAHPVWIDDPHFDIGAHIRREVLPTPGDGASLRRLVMRILARPLDMRRPLWEMTIVTGLHGGRVVIVNRAHHAMVDGVSSVDILSLLLDPNPEGYTPEPPPDGWQPRRAPSSWQLIRPLLWNIRTTHKSERTKLPAFWSTRRLPWTGLLKLSGTMFTPRPDLFFNRKIGPQRTGRGLKVPLSAFKSLKERYGCTVNDAVLAVVAEGLHRWFKARGENVPEKVRVFCPVSVRGDLRGRLGNQISGMVLELPTGELTIQERLRRINVTTGDLKRTRQAVAADKLAGLADWAPATLLVLAGRLMSNPQAGANINVTNIPGPQFPLYSGGAELLEVWPFAPLYPSMGVGVAIVSYNGDSYFGLTADPGIVPDVEEFTTMLREAAAECTALAEA